MGNYDPDTFLDTNFDDPMDTEVKQAPPGEYTAKIAELKTKNITIQKGENAGQERMILQISWVIDDDDGAVKKVTGRDENRVRQDIWLNFNEAGGLDSANNIPLARLRAAVNQNRKGRKWAPSMLKDQMATISVVQDGDYIKVDKVTSA